MHLHDYETTFILRHDLDEAEHNRIRERLWETISDNGGEILVFEDWGRRQLAYRIRKATHGHYLHFNYIAPAGVPADLERVVKVEDDIVRFMTIVLEKYADPEETRLIARQRQRSRLARTSPQPSEDRAGRGRGPRESAQTPMPVAQPLGTAVEAADFAAPEPAPAEEPEATDAD